MNHVWLLTTGSGDDGDEWHVESIHSTKNSAQIALTIHQAPIVRGDGTTYTRDANIELWVVLTLKEAEK